MDFQEAKRNHADLKAQLQANRLRYDEYVTALQQMRVRDSQGYVWTIDPDSGSWLRWDGSAWSPTQPPPEADTGSGFCANCRQPLAPGLKFCQRCGAALRRVGAPPVRSGRQEALAKTKAGSRVAQWSQRMWDILGIVGGIIMALVWYGYSSKSGEGPDETTSYAMALLPMALVLLRPVTDRLLMPFQRIRRKIPAMFLAGASLALPFLLSNCFFKLYADPSSGFITQGRKDEYKFMYQTFISSVLGSYVLLRDPIRRAKS